MQRKTGLLVFSFLLLLQPVIIHAQKEPAWKAGRLGPIEWMRITQLGYPVVGTLGSLKCLDPETGAVLWENKTLGTVSEDMLSEIEGTQYLKIGYGGDWGGVDPDALPSIAVVDVITGTVLFDSRKEKMGVLGMYPLPHTKKFMVVGAEPGKFFAKLFMYDMQSGNLLWVNEDIFKGNPSGKGGLLGKVAGAVQGVINMQSLTSHPVELDEEHIFITHPSYVIKLKAQDGATVWRAKIDESTNARLIYTRNKPDVIYAAAETESTAMTSTGNNPPAKVYAAQYYAFNITSGKPVWKAPVRINNERINFVLPGTNGLIILPAASGSNKPSVNQLDYETGAGLWGSKGKGNKIDGAVIDYIFTEQGLVIATGKESNNPNKPEDYFLNVLNTETGSLRYQKSLKLTGRLVRIEETPKGILYVTTHEVNIMDVNTGAAVLASSIESGGPKRAGKILPFPTADKDDKLYVFATREGVIKELDKNSGTVRSLNSTKIELGGKELPKYLDAFDEGIVVCSDQNVLMIGYDGLLKFTNYFNPPRESGLIRALALAEAIKGVYIGVALLAETASYAGIALTSTDASVQTLAGVGGLLTTGIAAMSFAYAGKALVDFNKRYKATTVTDDYLIVLSEVAPRDFRLIQVDKRTGKNIVSLDLGKDRDPVYVIDFIYQYVYYQSSAAEISCFKLR